MISIEFNFPNETVFSEVVTQELNSNDAFMCKGIELAKELLIIFYQVVSSFQYNEYGHLRRFDKDQSVIAGLLMKLTSLFSSIIEQLCNHKTDISQILTRCLLEIAVNIKYIINPTRSDIFKEYIEYSLQADAVFYKKICEDISKSGSISPIQERIKLSIENSFASNGYDTNKALERMRHWGENTIYDKFKAVNWEHLYLAYRVNSHAIHGNWQDITLHYIDQHDDGGELRYKVAVPRLQLINPLTIIVSEVCLEFLNYLAGHNDAYTSIIERVIQIQDKAIHLEDLHETFIGKH
jgi:hypothetical protein